MSKTKVINDIKINTYAIIDRAVEEGCQAGFRRAHKYSDSPSELQIIDEIHKAVMLSLTEIIAFDDE